MKITIDTHTIIWSVDEAQNFKIPKKTLDLIQKTEKDGVIYIPNICLMELHSLSIRKKLQDLFTKPFQHIKDNKNYKILNFTNKIMNIAITLDNALEMHDRIILATAIITDSHLITKDGVIKNFYSKIIW
jgi:PIN domain nuclease of toxin-antitoxin system